MNKTEFLSALATHVRTLPKTERDEIVADHTAHFDEGVARGKSEEEIAAALGDPRQIGKSYVADFRIHAVKDPTQRGSLLKQGGNILRAIIAVGALATFNLLFVFGPFVVAMATLLGLWIAASAVVAMSVFGVLLALGLSPFVLFSGEWGMAQQLPLAFYSVGALFLSCAAGLVLFWITKGAALLAHKYVRLNANIVTANASGV